MTFMTKKSGTAQLKRAAQSYTPQHILITGGAGFIGVNAARYFLKKECDVVIFDNLSRRGADVNLALLKIDFGKKFTFVKGDVITDFKKLQQWVEKVDTIIHLAAQVAVTTSVVDPRTDFEINAIGSFNIVEAVRLSQQRPTLLYSSTNKVYGSLHHRPAEEHSDHYTFADQEIDKYGVGEEEQLDFHSPYGCSKGIADQYVVDYSRVYGLKTVVFRQSCIYGPYQFGVEDQGWVAWFSIAALMNKPITVYGNGKQVRDLLYIDDLVELYDQALQRIDTVSGNAYNIGGSPANKLSLLQLLAILEEWFGREIPISYAATRIGDQPIFVADVRKIAQDIGWKPKHNVTAGFEKMMTWIEKHQDLIRKALQ